MQERKWPFFATAIMGLVLSYHIGKVAVGIARSGEVSDRPTGRISAQNFDRSLDWPEWLMGITTLRANITSRARGHVLELAVGTGRNMAYYRFHDTSTDTKGLSQSLHNDQDDKEFRRTKEILPTDVLSYTGVDISNDRLAVALRRAYRFIGKKIVGRGDANSIVRLLPGDVHSEIPLSPDGTGQYDTVIQTFGLCSVDNPAELVKSLASFVKPQFGRILLLEHGRGTWGMINAILDWSAPGRHARYGCWWNRDIEEIVQTAVTQIPGLEIHKIERPNLLQFGTILRIELRMNPRLLREHQANIH